MKLFHKILLLICILVPSLAQAQFYVTGDDPGKLNWNYIDTDNFRVIYPEGSDSLARIYAFKLEKYKIPVSRTTGYMAGHGDGRLMPAVLHTYNGANGSVAWAPKRMDLFTLPTPYNPEPMPWSTMLAVHEGRHVTQMQFGMTGNHKPFGYIFGEMWNILVSLVYPRMEGIEGDAVITETALTSSGRGRTADFLNYYRVAFDQGDYREWDRWLYGSQKYFAPDHYAFGYMTYGGLRYIYDYPMFMNDVYGNASKKILNIFPIPTLVKKKTGKKFGEMFKEVTDTMQGIWSRDAQERAPFIPMEKVTEEPRLYTNYSNTISHGNSLYTIKKGYLDSPKLIRIDVYGDEHFMTYMPHDVSDLHIHDGKLYWSEEKPDERWSMKSDSRIRYIDILEKKKYTVAENRKLLYNPSFSTSQMAATRYFTEGGSALYIDGETYMAPDSLQIVETAWIGDIVYATAISDSGFGIYSFKEGEWKTILNPQPVKITDFKKAGKSLAFACDRTSVNELYHLDPVSGELRQKTSTKYGATDYSYSEDGKYLYFSSPTLKGMHIFRTPVDSLIDRKVDYSDIYEYVIADCLAEQEKQVAMKDGYQEAVDPDIQVKISEPKRYKKAAHMFHIHSWTPFYVNVDNIMNMSYEHVFQAASLGASAIMQNRLATGVGEFGYSAHKDPYDRSKWRHSGHFKFTYSGLYPVIEAKVDFNDRAVRQFNTVFIKQGDAASVSMTSRELDSPYFEGRLSTYIPFNFSSGGWYKGIIPKISYTLTNDMFNTSVSVLENPGIVDGYQYPANPPFIGVTEGKNSFRHYLSGSLRAYTILSTPNSAVYPRWGIGAEVGANKSFNTGNIISPMGYAYLYGYVPGIIREQGLKLSIMHQQKLDKGSIFGQPMVSVMPRGLTSTASLASYMSIMNPSITKFSADYAIPIYIGDISIGRGFLYIKRLCLTPHVDFTRAGQTNLMSLGSALTIDLNGIVWINWPASVGATYSYNGLADYNMIKSSTGLDMDLHHVGFIFNVSF